MHPRQPSRSPSGRHLTPAVAYLPNNKSPYSQPSGIDDPRTSSTQSLLPAESVNGDKRKLLLVYIHGFLGAEASFQSFPAHVHSLLAISLADSHVIHTKIYPRYQSRKNISFARDNFSNWLYPHESSNTDVVLLGHSLGGILSAEVVLIPCHVPGSNDLLQHRILGQIAFDTPFLGMHPGVVSTGIASLFRGAPEEPAPSVNLDQSEVLSFSSDDPNYNPTFDNDVKIPTRNGKWERAWYFWNKHAGHVTKAAKSYVMSHFEFGGCLADYPGLRRRYEAIRGLEDVNELKGLKGPNGRLLQRVRFVNYYTASTGRIKPSQPVEDGQLVTQTEMQTLNPVPKESSDVTRSSSNTFESSSSQIHEPDLTQKTSGLSLDAKPQLTSPAPEVTANKDQPDGDLVISDNPASKGEIESEELREHHKRQATLNPEQYDKHLLSETHHKAKSKDRKFCTLPTKDKTGARDSTWVRVYMEGVDEVVAHTSLFNISETYARLVGDVAERITGWVHEDATTRALLGGAHMMD